MFFIMTTFNHSAVQNGWCIVYGHYGITADTAYKKRLHAATFAVQTYMCFCIQHVQKFYKILGTQIEK